VFLLSNLSILSQFSHPDKLLFKSIQAYCALSRVLVVMQQTLIATLSFTPMFCNPTTLFNEMLHMKGQP
jgi:hypothetical protein